MKYSELMYIYDSLTQDAKLPPHVRTFFTKHKRQALAPNHKALSSKLAGYASAADLINSLQLDLAAIYKKERDQPYLNAGYSQDEVNKIVPPKETQAIEAVLPKLRAACQPALQERHIQYYYENNYVKQQLTAVASANYTEFPLTYAMQARAQKNVTLAAERYYEL